jgi:hypothetical protein
MFVLYFLSGACAAIVFNMGRIGDCFAYLVCVNVSGLLAAISLTWSQVRECFVGLFVFFKRRLRRAFL